MAFPVIPVLLFTGLAGLAAGAANAKKKKGEALAGAEAATDEQAELEAPTLPGEPKLVTYPGTTAPAGPDVGPIAEPEKQQETADDEPDDDETEAELEAVDPDAVTSPGQPQITAPAPTVAPTLVQTGGQLLEQAGELLKQQGGGLTAEAGDDLTERVPDDTAAMVAGLLAKEGTRDWKQYEPSVALWQAKRGLVSDGRLGPKTNLRLAQEIGTLPIVRYWPRGSLASTALEPYRRDVMAIAANSPDPRKSLLAASAAREQGQGFGTYTKAIEPVITLEGVDAGIGDALEAGAQLDAAVAGYLNADGTPVQNWEYLL